MITKKNIVSVIMVLFFASLSFAATPVPEWVSVKAEGSDVDTVISGIGSGKKELYIDEDEEINSDSTNENLSIRVRPGCTLTVNPSSSLLTISGMVKVDKGGKIKIKDSKSLKLHRLSKDMIYTIFEFEANKTGKVLLGRGQAGNEARVIWWGLEGNGNYTNDCAWYFQSAIDSLSDTAGNNLVIYVDADPSTDAISEYKVSSSLKFMNSLANFTWHQSPNARLKYNGSSGPLLYNTWDSKSYNQNGHVVINNFQGDCDDSTWTTGSERGRVTGIRLVGIDMYKINSPILKYFNVGIMIDGGLGYDNLDNYSTGTHTGTTGITTLTNSGATFYADGARKGHIVKNITAGTKGELTADPAATTAATTLYGISTARKVWNNGDSYEIRQNLYGGHAYWGTIDKPVIRVGKHMVNGETKYPAYGIYAMGSRNAVDTSDQPNACRVLGGAITLYGDASTHYLPTGTAGAFVQFGDMWIFDGVSVETYGSAYTDVGGIYCGIKLGGDWASECATAGGVRIQNCWFDNYAGGPSPSDSVASGVSTDYSWVKKYGYSFRAIYLENPPAFADSDWVNSTRNVVTLNNFFRNTYDGVVGENLGPNAENFEAYTQGSHVSTRHNMSVTTTPFNLLKNGSFEFKDPKDSTAPLFWAKGNSANATWSFDTSTKAHGQYGFKILGNSGATYSSEPYLSQNFRTRKAGTYTFFANVKSGYYQDQPATGTWGTAYGRAYFKLYKWNGSSFVYDNKYFHSSLYHQDSITPLSYTCVLEDDALYQIRIVLYVYDAQDTANNCAIYLDSVGLYHGSYSYQWQPSPWDNKPVISDSGTVSASLKNNTWELLKTITIPKTILGDVGKLTLNCAGTTGGDGVTKKIKVTLNGNTIVWLDALTGTDDWQAAAVIENLNSSASQRSSGQGLNGTTVAHQATNNDMTCSVNTDTTEPVISLYGLSASGSGSITAERLTVDIDPGYNN